MTTVLQATATAILSTVAISAAALAQPPKIRDSAGIRIVENPSRLKAPVVFQLGTSPILDVGGVEANPDDEFDHRQGYLRGVRLSDGGLAVIDVARVHFFDAKGKRLRIVGRKGRGPEEFLYLGAICRTRGDTLLVGDQHNRRVSVLSPTGAILGTILQEDKGYPPFDFCLDDGTFVFLQRLGAPTESGKVRLTRIRTDRSFASSIDGLTGRSFDMVTQSGIAIAAVGQRIYYGQGERSEVQILSPTGSLQAMVRSDDPPIPISEAEVERRLTGSIPRNVSDAQRSAQLARMRAMPHASHWPAYRDIMLDPSGRMWIQDYQIEYPGPEGWTAFDPNGQLIGRLVIPTRPPGQRLQIISFGNNDVLVRRQDADGGAHLTIYPLTRRTP